MPKNAKPTPPQQSGLAEMWGAGKKKRKVDQPPPAVPPSEDGEEKKAATGQERDETVPNSLSRWTYSILVLPTQRAQISRQGITVAQTYNLLSLFGEPCDTKVNCAGHTKKRRVADSDEEVTSKPPKDGQLLSSRQSASQTTVTTSAEAHPSSLPIVKGKAKPQTASPEEDELSSSAAEEEEAAEDVLQSEGEEATQQ